ncbi:MAG: extracellular solute-binding protein [Alphaproteobacteria bacterium]
MIKNFSVAFLLVLLAVPCLAKTYRGTPTHGIAMHGTPKYGAEDSFEYVNSDAPLGGELIMGALGTFNTTNPFVTKGLAPGGLSLFDTPLVFERLMVRAKDEPFTLYGRIAESIEVADDRSWIIFNINPRARWSDGIPVTAHDVAFTHKTLKEKGRPNMRLFYGRVQRVKILSPHRVLFLLKKIDGEDAYDPELPLLIGLMSVLPKHALEGKDFEKVNMTEVPGSGPYKIAKVDMGHSISYERRKNYWGWTNPKLAGMYNFENVRYDYYRTDSVLREAFKAGAYDVKAEANPMHWRQAYNFKAVQDGKVIKETIKHSRPVPLTGFVMNRRRPQFEDRRVRQALELAFDYDWINKNLFYGEHKRSRSFFDNTDLAARGIPQGKELALLEPFRKDLPEEVFTIEYNPSKSDGTGNNRKNLKRAKDLLAAAGWHIQNNQLVNAAGEPFEMEILLYRPDMEKVALAFQRSLKRLGITAKIRTVEAASFEQRRLAFDFDVIINSWSNSLSPGREQQFYWGSQFADEQGSRNYPGIKNPAVDHLCNVIATAKDRETLKNAAWALDRVLMWGINVISFGYRDVNNLAHWDKFGHPEFKPMVASSLMTWWSKDANKESRWSKQIERG